MKELEGKVEELQDLDEQIAKARTEYRRLRKKCQEASRDCYVSAYKSNSHSQEIEQKRRRIADLDHTVDIYKNVEISLIDFYS